MSKKYHKPPKTAYRLFQRFLPKADRSYLNGDFDEIFNDIYNNKGRFTAFLWYWFQVISSFPEIFANLSLNPTLNWLDIIGILFWVIGFYFEAIADYQLRKFKKYPENKGKISDQGLWKYTQHPNYFGETLMWWSLYLLVLNVPYGFFTIFGPIIITFIIIKVSGVRLLNKRFKRDDKYADYKRRTRAFIPWFPKKRN